MQIPHKQLGIKVLITYLANPPHSPGTKFVDDRC